MWLPADRPTRISFGALLLIGWFAQVNGWRVTAYILLAAVLHELGHLLVLRMVGAKIKGISIGILGAVMEADTHCLSYGQELAAVLAGPLMNLLTAFICGTVGADPVFVGASAVLCGFNLLPMRPLDGGRALQLFLVWKCGPGTGERFAGWIGGMTGLLLAASLGYLMYRTGGSLWLLPPAWWMLHAGIREFLGK